MTWMPLPPESDSHDGSGTGQIWGEDQGGGVGDGGFQCGDDGQVPGGVDHPVLGGEALVRFLSRSSLRVPATRMARMPISAPEKNTAIAAVEMMDVIASPFGLERLSPGGLPSLDGVILSCFPCR